MTSSSAPVFGRRLIGLLTLGLFSPALSGASDEATPTFNQDVKPILAANCMDCHREGGANYMGVVAPMAFGDYASVRPWARSIARQAESRQMPPWHASPQHDGVFVNQRTLTADEIATLVDWVEGGAPEGPPVDTAPPAPAPAGDWQIGEPDLIVRFEEPVLVEDEVEDVYKTVTVRIPDEDLPEDRWIRAMEFRPGSDVVHHIVIFTSDQRESLGFPQGMLGGMGPGTDATVFPSTHGRKLTAGSTIIFNMHYHKEPGEGTAVYDRSEIAFRFHEGPVETEVHWGAVGTMAFSIPPNTPSHEVVAEHTLERSVDLFALFPHTHLRGKASRISAIYPNGDDEILLDVPEYDFNWQTNYIYKQPKRLPAGTRIKVQMWYDNSVDRAELAGIDPTRTVTWGQPTTDEMMYGFLDYAYADDPQPASDD